MDVDLNVMLYDTVGHVFDMFWSCLRHVTAYLKYVLGMFEACLGHI